MNRATVQAAIDKAGELVELRRRSGSGANAQDFAVTTRGIVRAAQATALPGELAQTRRHVTIGYAELERTAWPAPPQQGDTLMIDGASVTVEAVETRRIGDRPARYELTVMG